MQVIRLKSVLHDYVRYRALSRIKPSRNNLHKAKIYNSLRVMQFSTENKDIGENISESLSKNSASSSSSYMDYIPFYDSKSKANSSTFDIDEAAVSESASVADIPKATTEGAKWYEDITNTGISGLFSKLNPFSSSEVSDIDHILSLSPCKEIENLPHGPINSLEKLLYHLHEFSGLPWYQTIFLFGILVKVILIPLSVYNRKSALRMVIASRKIVAFRKQKQREISKAGKQPTDAVKLKILAQRKVILKKCDADPKKVLFFQALPLGFLIMSFMATRRVCLEYLELAEGGISNNFYDLSQPDTGYMLVTAFGIVSMSNLWCTHSLTKQMRVISKPDAATIASEENRQMFAQALTVGFLPIVWYFAPSGSLIFLISSVGSTALTNYFLATEPYNKYLKAHPEQVLKQTELSFNPIDKNIENLTKEQRSKLVPLSQKRKKIP